MNFKRNKNLLNEAMSAGVKTMAEFALYLKAHTHTQCSLYR